MATKDSFKPVTVSSSGAGRAVVMRLSTLVKVFLVVVLVGLSFYGGLLYGSSGGGGAQQSSSNSATHHFAIGLVVYVSPSSITIANDENTNTQTFTLNSKTIISVNGVKASISQLKAGYRVLIRVSKKNPSRANIVIADNNFSG